MDTLLHVGLGNALAAVGLALLAAGVGCCCRAPALRHGLWLLVLLQLIAPPLLPVRVPLPVTPDAAPAANAPMPRTEIHTEPRETVASAPLPYALPELPPAEPALRAAATTPLPTAPVAVPAFPWKPLVMIVWLTGSALWWALAAWRIRRFQRVLRLARPAPAAVACRCEELAHRLRLRRAPGVWFLPGPLSPMLWAVGRTPRLLLPEALWRQLTPEQRDTLLVHELAHLRRHDHWVRRLELVVLGLYWWHPVVWWARHEIQAAEEECCDAWVVWALPGAAPAYATALLATLTFVSQARPALPLTASGIGRVRLLKRRMTMILCGTTTRTLTWGGFLAVLSLAALLPLTWAEAPRDRTTESPSQVDQPPAPAGREQAAASDTRAEPTDLAQDPARAPRTTTKIQPDAGLTRDGEIQQANDEIELLEAQVAVKRAQVRAAAVGVEQAKKRRENTQKLFKQGVVGIEEVERAGGDVTAAEAQVQVKEAELREPEVRLKQARRRLEQLKGQADRPRQDGAKLAPGSAAALFDVLNCDLGRVWQGNRVELQVGMRNRTRQAFHIATTRSSAAFLKVSAPDTVPPGERASLTVQVDTSRVLGPKVATVYVVFDQPQTETVQLTFKIESLAPSGKDAARGQRLEDMQKRLEALTREIEQLRRELRQKQSAAPPLNPPQPGVNAPVAAPYAEWPAIYETVPDPANPGRYKAVPRGRGANPYQDPRSTPTVPLNPPKEKQ